MKSFKLLLLAVLLLGVFAGCTYNESPVYSTDLSETYDITIRSHQWDLVEPGYWVRRLYMPNLTKSVIDYGAVIVYYKNSVNNWVMTPYQSVLYNVLGQQFAEEIWFGYSLQTLDIEYVYTNPLDMTPPDRLELKVVFLKL